MNLLPELRLILVRLNITADPVAFISVYTLIMARMGAALSFIPFLGGQAVPGNVQAGWTMLIGIVLYPWLSQGVTDGTAPGFLSATWLAVLFKELLIGLLIGLLIQIVFSAVEAAGTLIEFTAELRQDEILAPQVPAATGPLSALMGHAAIVIYLTAGVHLVFIRALADSYRVIPLFNMPAFRPGFLPLAEFAGRVAAGFIVVAFQLSAPVIFILVLIKVGSGLMFRMSFAGVRADPFQPFSSLAAYGLLFLGAGLISDQIVRQALGYLSQLSQFLNGLR